MVTVLILGATSGIAKALAEEYARKGYDLQLAGRVPAELQNEAKRLQEQYSVTVQVLAFEALDYAGHAAFYEQLSPRPLGVVCAFGVLGDQQAAQSDFELAQQIIAVNYLGAVSILNLVANDMEARRDGFIIGISSVAGDRGRK